MIIFSPAFGGDGNRRGSKDKGRSKVSGVSFTLSQNKAYPLYSDLKQQQNPHIQLDVNAVKCKHCLIGAHIHTNLCALSFFPSAEGIQACSPKEPSHFCTSRRVCL